MSTFHILWPWGLNKVGPIVGSGATQIRVPGVWNGPLTLIYQQGWEWVELDCHLLHDTYRNTFASFLPPRTGNRKSEPCKGVGKEVMDHQTVCISPLWWTVWLHACILLLCSLTLCMLRSHCSRCTTSSVIYCCIIHRNVIFILVSCGFIKSIKCLELYCFYLFTVSCTLMICALLMCSIAGTPSGNGPSE